MYYTSVHSVWSSLFLNLSEVFHICFIFCWGNQVITNDQDQDVACKPIFSKSWLQQSWRVKNRLHIIHDWTATYDFPTFFLCGLLAGTYSSCFLKFSFPIMFTVFSHLILKEISHFNDSMNRYNWVIPLPFQWMSNR